MLRMVRGGGDLRIAAGRRQRKNRQVRVIESMNGIVGRTGVIGVLAEYTQPYRARLDLKMKFIIRVSGDAKQGQGIKARRFQILWVVAVDLLHRIGVGLIT